MNIQTGPVSSPRVYSQPNTIQLNKLATNIKTSTFPRLTLGNYVVFCVKEIKCLLYADDLLLLLYREI